MSEYKGPKIVRQRCIGYGLAHESIIKSYWDNGEITYSATFHYRPASSEHYYSYIQDYGKTCPVIMIPQEEKE